MYSVYTCMLFLLDAVANVYISIWTCLFPAWYLCQWLACRLEMSWTCLCQSPACIEEFVTFVTFVTWRIVYISVYCTCTLWLSAVFFIFWGMCLVMNCCDYCKWSLFHVYCYHKPDSIIYKYVTASSDQLCSKWKVWLQRTSGTKESNAFFIIYF